MVVYLSKWTGDTLILPSRDQGAEVTLEQKNQALKELEVYRRWFHDNVLKPEGDGGSDAILIVPCGSGEPKYRDLPNS
jgi:hypothetical protein